MVKKTQSLAHVKFEILSQFNPPPPAPIFGPEGSFRREGIYEGGVYFEAPRGRNFIRPPSFIRPPPLEGYFQGLDMLAEQPNAP